MLTLVCSCWDRDYICRSTAKRLLPKAQGCRVSGYPGGTGPVIMQPQRGCGLNPFRVGNQCHRFPNVAAVAATLGSGSQPPCGYYRSISPSTISNVPIIATTSATRWPMLICFKACRLIKDGGRTRTRQGCCVPSETR